MESTLGKSFWSSRWKDQLTGWDIGKISDPFVPFFEKLDNKSLKILIPGCGNAYEAEYLWTKGFSQVHVVDIAPEPLQLFSRRVPDFPASQLHCADFFDLRGTFDLVVEQTFFCALHPSLRPRYVAHMRELITPGGLLAGLLFNFPLTEEGPPFGGSKPDYLALFADGFAVRTMEPCSLSIAPRAGRELWIELERLP